MYWKTDSSHRYLVCLQNFIQIDLKESGCVKVINLLTPHFSLRLTEENVVDLNGEEDVCIEEERKPWMSAVQRGRLLPTTRDAKTLDANIG